MDQQLKILFCVQEDIKYFHIKRKVLFYETQKNIETPKRRDFPEEATLGR